MDLTRTARGHLLTIMRRDLGINARLAAMVLDHNERLADHRGRDHRGARLEVVRMDGHGSGYAILTAADDAAIHWSVAVHVPRACMHAVAPSFHAREREEAAVRAAEEVALQALHARFPIDWIERTIAAVEIRDGAAVMTVVENPDERFTMMRASWQDQASFEQYVSETEAGPCRMYVGPLSSFTGRGYDCVAPEGTPDDAMIVDMTIPLERRLAA